MIYIKKSHFRTFAPLTPLEKSWRGSPEQLGPPPPIEPIHISIKSSQREDSVYIVLIGIHSWRPKVMLSAASCPQSTFWNQDVHAHTYTRSTLSKGSLTREITVYDCLGQVARSDAWIDKLPAKHLHSSNLNITACSTLLCIHAKE